MLCTAEGMGLILCVYAKKCEIANLPTELQRANKEIFPRNLSIEEFQN